jgi:hypothetical protein
LTGYWLSNYSSVQVLALLNALAVTCSASAAFTNIQNLQKIVNLSRWEMFRPDIILLKVRQVLNGRG